MAKVAFEIGKFDRFENEEILKQIKNASDRGGYFNSFYDLAAETILTIHGIPDLFSRPNINLSEIEIYIGRSHRGNVLNRLRRSMQTRGHDYGVIAGETQTASIENVESSVLRIFKVLKENKKLCVANVANQTVASFGDLPNSEDSLIYVTWKNSTRSDYYGATKSNSNLFDEIAESAGEKLVRPKLNKLREVLSFVSQPSKSKAVWWHKDHN